MIDTERVCVSVWVSERKREGVCERVRNRQRGHVCERQKERESMCERETEMVCVGVGERDKQYV